MTMRGRGEVTPTATKRFLWDNGVNSLTLPTQVRLGAQIARKGVYVICQLVGLVLTALLIKRARVEKPRSLNAVTSNQSY